MSRKLVSTKHSSDENALVSAVFEIFFGAHVCVCVVFSSSSNQASDSVLCMHVVGSIGAGLCWLVSPRNRLFQAGANRMSIVLYSRPFCTAQPALVGVPAPAQGSAGQQVAGV